MNVWIAAAIVLMLGGLVPALLIGSRRGPVDRLVGLAFSGALTVLVMLVLGQAFGSSSYLIVPLVLALLSVTGILVFTRLLGPR